MDSSLRLLVLYDGAQADEGMARTAAVAEESSSRIGHAGEKAGHEFSDGLDKGTSKIGSIFQKIGQSAGNWGLPFSNEIQKIGREFGEIETRGKAFGDSMAALGGVAVAGIIGVGAETVHLADQFDTMQSALQRAVENSGHSWSQYSAQINAAYKSGAQLGFENNEVAQSLQQLTNATNSPAKALQNLGLAENLARTEHESLATATSQLVRVFGGSTRVLQQLGINLDIGSGKMHSVQSAAMALQSAQLSLKTTQGEIADQQLKGSAATGALAAAELRVKDATINYHQAAQAIPDVLAKLEQRTHGVATAYSHTLPGAMAAARSEVHNLGVAFGQDLEPDILKAGSFLARLVSDVIECKPALIALAAIIGPVLGGAIASFAFKGVSGFVGGIGKMIGGIEGLILKSRAGAAGITNAEGEIVGVGQRSAAEQVAQLQEVQAARQENLAMAQAAAAAVDATDTEMAASMQAWAAEAQAALAKVDAELASLGPAANAAAEAMAGAEDAMVAGTDEAAVGIDGALISTGIGAALVALGIAVDLLATHWKSVWHDMLIVVKGVAQDIENTLAIAFNTIVQVYNDTLGKLHVNILGHHFGLPQLHKVGEPGWAQFSGLTWKSNSAGGAPFKLPATPTPGPYTASPGSKITLPTTPTGAGPHAAAPANTSLTPGEVALENVATRFESVLKLATMGGTQWSQQGATMAALTKATTPEMARSMGSLVGSLNATNNPTLVKLATSIESSWKAATQKITTIIDEDTKTGQSELQKLQNATNSSSIASLRAAVEPAARTSFNMLVGELKSVHSKALAGLIAQLEGQWATTNADYRAVLRNIGTIRRAGRLEVTAARIGGETTLAGAESSAAVGISGARSTLSQNVLAAAAQRISDSSKVAQDHFTAAAQAISDAASVASAVSTQQATAITDAAKIAQDKAQEEANDLANAAKVQADAANLQVEAIKAQTTALQDSSNAQVAAITDQAQTQVDVLGERGKYGLALEAQMAKVAVDQQKAVDDQAIAAAQAHLDQVTAQTNQQVAIDQQKADVIARQTALAQAAAQAQADLTQQRTDTAVQAATVNAAKVQQHSDAVVAKAQAHADQVTLIENAKVARAQEHLDQVTIHGDIAVAKVTAHADQVAIRSAVENAAAQAHVDAMQYANQVQQDAAQANQRFVQAQTDAANAAAQAVVQSVTDSANKADQNAQNAYNQAQAAASKAESAASAQLAHDQGAAAVANANAQASLAAQQADAAVQNAKMSANLQAVQSAAALQQAQAAAQLSADQNNATIQQALASEQLTIIQANAAKQQAILQATYNVESAKAQVEYAGSGINVFITGVPLDNAAAIGASASYAVRYQTGR